MKPSFWPAPPLLFIAGGLLAVLGLVLSPAFLGSRLAIGAPFALSLVVAAAGSLLLLVAMAAVIVVPPGGVAAARRAYGSHKTIVGLTVLAGVGALAVVLPTLIQFQVAGRSPMMQGFTLVLSAVVLDAVLISIVYFRVVRPGIITWRDMGLTRATVPRSWPAWVLAPLAMIAIVVVIQLTLRQLGVQQTQLDAVQWVRGVPGWQFALIVFATAVLTPLAEELYFRGYVFRAYYTQKGPLPAYLFSSVLFALVHFNPPAFLPIFAVGLFLAFLYKSTGSVLPGIVAHAFNNGIAFTALYLAAP